MTGSKEIWRKTVVQAISGALAFWVANFVISRTPIAAEYRVALSISYYPMLIESLMGGLIIGASVSYLLLRFFDRIPANDPLAKSILLSFAFLVIITIMIGGPSRFIATNDAPRYFLIGTVFNLIRVLALGIAIGYVCKRQYKGNNLSLFPSTLGRIK